MAEVTCTYKPRECQPIRHYYSTLNIYIDLNGVLITEIRTSSFCVNKLSWKRDTVQGEKAGRIPQLLQARAKEAEVAPNAKNSLEVTCVYGPP